MRENRQETAPVGSAVATSCCNRQEHRCELPRLSLLSCSRSFTQLSSASASIDMDVNSTQTDDPIQKFLEYPFDTDEVYQVCPQGMRRKYNLIVPSCKQGLAGILSGGTFQEQDEANREELLLRSRVFYFNQ